MRSSRSDLCRVTDHPSTPTILYSRLLYFIALFDYRRGARLLALLVGAQRARIFPLNSSLAPSIVLTCMRSFSRVISTPPPGALTASFSDSVFWCRLYVRKGRLVSGSAISCSQCSASSRFPASCNFISGAVRINSFMTAWEHSALYEMTYPNVLLVFAFRDLEGSLWFYKKN